MHNVVNALNDTEIVHLKMVNYMIYEIHLNFTLQCMMNLYPSQNNPTRGTDIFFFSFFFNTKQAQPCLASEIRPGCYGTPWPFSRAPPGGQRTSLPVKHLPFVSRPPCWTSASQGQRNLCSAPGRNGAEPPRSGRISLCSPCSRCVP